jgi:hypothetical protein
MQKKKFDLTSDIIQVNIGEEKEYTQSVNKNTETIKEEKVKNRKKVFITIAVYEELRREYKMWCTREGLKMAEAFLRGYELLKKNNLS